MNDLADQLRRSESEAARMFKSAAIDFGVDSPLTQAMKSITDQRKIIDSLGASAFAQSELANARAFSSAMFTVPNSVFSNISELDGILGHARRQLTHASEIARAHESLFSVQAALSKLNIPQFQFPVIPRLEIPAFPVVDWDEAQRAHHDSAMRLADLGWTTPNWMTLPDLRRLAKASEEEVDTFFLESYLHAESGELKPIADGLLNCPRMAQWRSMLEEVFACIVEGKYRVSVPALISILEGFIAESLCQLNMAPRRQVNVSASIKATKWHEQNDFTALFWKSVVVFLANLFASSDFEAAAPVFINRHWILHGRSATEWTATDALKLVNALATVHWLFE